MIFIPWQSPMNLNYSVHHGEEVPVVTAKTGLYFLFIVSYGNKVNYSHFFAVLDSVYWPTIGV